jgi:hypothetical protein
VPLWAAMAASQSSPSVLLGPHNDAVPVCFCRHLQERDAAQAAAQKAKEDAAQWQAERDTLAQRAQQAQREVEQAHQAQRAQQEELRAAEEEKGRLEVRPPIVYAGGAWSVGLSLVGGFGRPCDILLST